MAAAPLGPLHGVPTAMKDVFDFKPGWPSTLGGVRALKDNAADSYCAFAERMEKAGAIILGKTNAPTLGFHGTCDNYLFGPSAPFFFERPITRAVEDAALALTVPHKWSAGTA
jgi:amidase/aspartyl-tRNA(Asn)/glutamyl-tRNA(Gln) amidotransferase subunit A